MKLTLVKRDPGVGYVGRNLWLPLRHVNVRSVKAGLEFPIMTQTGMEFRQLWREDREHIIVPREFTPKEDYHRLPFEIVSALPTKYPHVRMTSKIVLDFKDRNETVQRDAAAAFKRASCGILNLACGVGKTVVALDHMAEQAAPALVVVNNTTLINQWMERIETFLDVEGGVGVVQGKAKHWDWRGRGIVIAMINTLANNWDNLPPGFARYFKNVYFDECHHLSADYFSLACPMFFGNRYGLTATTNREDGLELIYMYHFGGVFFKYLKQKLKPRIYFQMSPFQVNSGDPEVWKQITDVRGKPCLPKLRGYIGTHPDNNAFIASKMREPLKMGRKVLALSHSVGQLQALHDMFPSSGLCTGNEDPADRIRTLKEKNLTLGTLQLVKEALDEDTLDTLFFLTPFGSFDVVDGGKNTLQQGMGRILRVREGKRVPVVHIFDYFNIPKFHRQCNKLKQVLTRWPEDEGGPFEYQLLRP